MRGDRRAIVVEGVGDRFSSVTMTEEALELYRPVKVFAGTEPRRQIPAGLVGEPADGRGEEQAVSVHQVGAAVPAGTDREPDLGFQPGENAAARILTDLTVEDVFAPALH